jgi:oxygen-independent coproporphyrinogen-3 oxidase
MPAELPDLDRIVDALGPAAQVAYAPFNIYPMSAPRFSVRPDAVREHPASDELGIYVHVPFCNHRCTFCFYATRLTPSVDEMRRYVRALVSELSWVKPGSRLTQFYCGGGTPTALPADLLDVVLSSVFERVERNRGGEVNTVECSPESITPEHVDVLLKHGIERVSMGVQTLQGRVQAAVHREHAAERVFESCRLLVSAGFMVNVDLIYGLPEQTEAGFVDDFTALAEQGVHAFTAYHLRVNERTPVGRALAAEERLDVQRLVRWRSLIRTNAQRLGFLPTRWHTFKRRDPATAADGVRRFRDVTGQGEQFSAGISARSRLNHTVFRNHSAYDEYLQCIERGQSPVAETVELSADDRRVRYLALTLGDGYPLSREDYAQTLGRDLDVDHGDLLGTLADLGLVYDAGPQITLTSQGQLIYDLVLRAFYPQPVRHWLEKRQELAQTAANLHSSAIRAAG